MRITDPIRQITDETLESVWRHFRQEIANYNPVFSPNLAGEIAAARIMNAYTSAVMAYSREMDYRAENDLPITDEQDALYGELPHQVGKFSRALEHLSGIRTWCYCREHPLAFRPLDAEPLSPSPKCIATRE